MEADEDEIHDFFNKFVKTDKVYKLLQPLTNLRQLACSNSVEDFILSYTALLDASGTTQPQIVERICAARQDMTRQDVNDVVEQCKDIYMQRQKSKVAEQHAQSMTQPTSKLTLWQRVKQLGWG